MKRITIWFLMLVTVFGLYGGRAAVMHAQTDNTVEFINFYSGGFNTILTDGDIAYIGEENQFKIFDLSDPATPVVLGQVSLPSVGWGGIQDIQLSESIAYLAHGANGLFIVDVSSPSNPTVLGSYDPDGTSNENDENGDFLASGAAVDVVNGTAYMADGYNGLAMIDVSDPSTPTLLSTYATVTSNFPFPREGEPVEDVAVVGNIAYVANNSKGLLILDVSNPAMPTLISEYTHDEYGGDTYIYDIEIVDNIAYVYDLMVGIIMLDISDPISPVFTGTALESIEVNAYTISNDLLYVTQIDRFSVVDVSNKNNPTVLVIHEEAPQFSSGIRVEDETIYITGESENVSGLYIYSYNSNTTTTPDPDSPIQLLGSFNGTITSFFPDNDSAIVYLGQDDQFTILDVSDPSLPTVIGESTLPFVAEDNMNNAVTVVGNVAYLAYGSEGLHIFDVSDPANPMLITSFDTDESPVEYATTFDCSSCVFGRANDVEVANGIAYIADGSNGLVMVDVSNSSQPVLLGSYNDEYMYSSQVEVDGHIAHVGSQIIDVSNPASPVLLSSYQQDVVSLNIEGSIAYLGDHMDGGFHVVDVNNPNNPTLLGSRSFYIHPAFGGDIDVVGTTIYFVGGTDETLEGLSNGLTLFDASDPTNLTSVASFEIDTSKVRVAGELIYIVNPTGDLYILRQNIEILPLPTQSPTMIPPTYTSTPSPTPTDPTNSTDPTPEPTVTPTPSPTSILPTAVPTSTPIPDGDGYENDDVCGEARTISPDGTSQQHTFDEYGDVDWLEFEAIDGVVYQIVAEAVGSSAADLVAEVYADCDIAFQAEQSHSFAPSVILNVTARQNGLYKVKIYNDDPAVFGDNVAYRVSVTEVTNTNVGAVVIVGGRDQADDHLQDNIHDVTNRVYKMFAQNGYSESRIHYLATDFTPNGDPDVVVDGEATAANLQDIITNQLFNQVSDQQPLTIYMMSHGFATGGFYLDEVNDERVSPEQLDAWLDELQANRPGVEINIIIDACYAGQFISNSLGDTISGQGRVVITSSANNELAWSSFNGANFSDYFLVGIHQRKTVYQAFEAARWAVSSGLTVQHAWIDDNGDGIHNTANDGHVAAERYLLSPDGSFGTTWEPYIESVVVDGMASVATIQARVLSDPDGLGVETVQAVLYPPSFEPNVDGDRLLTTEGLPTVELTLDENGWYVGSIPLDEMGVYEVSIHAQGNAPANLDVSLQARPIIQTFTNNGDSVIPLTVDHLETTLKSPLLSLSVLVVVVTVFAVTTTRLVTRRD